MSKEQHKQYLIEVGYEILHWDNHFCVIKDKNNRVWKLNIFENE